MALNSGKILMRRGQEVNFDPNKMMPGEWAVSLDSKFVRMCFSPGVCIRMATYEAFEADMEQIREILAECQTVEEAVQRIYEEIKDAVVDVERIEAAAASALKSEENALNSANSAIQSANTATQKANEAAGSANIASAKAEQATQGANTATEGASTATQKASEAAESAGNVRNMSEVSESYAVGGTGTREGEDTDNAKYYNQQASDNADRAEEAAERASVAAGFGGTYTELRNKPTINNVELVGNKTLDELGIASKESLKETDNKVNIIIEKAELNIKETAMGENIHLIDSAEGKAVEFALYGKAVQNGTPTPETPIDIEVAGSDGSVEVKSIGKNILENTATSQTINGVDFVVNEDGSLTVNGTATANASYSLKPKFKKGTYIASGCPSGGNASTYSMLVQKSDGSGHTLFEIGKGRTFTIEEDDTVMWIYPARIVKGTTVNNLTFYPMIRRCDENGNPIGDDTYEPYKETLSTIPTPNGLAGIPVDSGGNYTDQDGQQWICDEIIKYADGSGAYIQRIRKVVYDGVNIAFTGKSGSTKSNIFYSNNSTAYIKKPLSNESLPYVLCSYFKRVSINDGYSNGLIGVYQNSSISNVYFSFGLDTEITTLELANAWLVENPFDLYYALETPIRTPLTAEQIAEIEKLYTFYPVTNISNDFDCGMKVKYIVDSKNYIDNQLVIQAKLQEEALLNMLLLMPEEVQASMIEKDTNNLLNESEV